MITAKVFATTAEAVKVVPDGWWNWHVRNNGPDIVAYGEEGVTFATGTQIAVNAEAGDYRVDPAEAAAAIYVVTDTDETASCRVVADV